MATVSIRSTQGILACLLLLGTIPALTGVLVNKPGIIHRITGTSFNDCKTVCTKRRNCSSISYLRRYSICELYLWTTEIREVRGSSIISVNMNKSADIISLFDTKCGSCLDTEDCYVRDKESEAVCEINMCSAPKYVSGARLFGNLRRVGSKLKYRCLTPFLGKHVDVICGRDGKWTETDIFCTHCKLPEVDHGIVTMPMLDGETIQGRVNCADNFTLRQSEIPTCLSETGVWSQSLDLVCCDKIEDGPWKLIFRLNSEFEKSITGVYRFGSNFINKTMSERCQYRDDDVITFWNLYNIQRVKMELIKDGIVAAYMIFNGVNTEDRSWFSFERLLESSWADLTTMKALNNPVSISFYGQIIDGEILRLIVTDSIADATAKCDSDQGWMFVTNSNHYPCNSNRNHTGTKIVYSAVGQKVKLQEGFGIEYADQLQISVDMPFGRK